MATFGYESKGANYQSCGNRITGSVFTINEDGTLDKITVWLYSGAGATIHAKCAIYKHSDLSLVGVTEERFIKFEDIAYDFNFSDPKPSLDASTEYIPVVWGRTADGNLYCYYDAGDTNQGHYDSEAYNSFPNPLVPTHENRKYSIYCTYTPSGGATQVSVVGSTVLSGSLVRDKAFTLSGQVVLSGTPTLGSPLERYVSGSVDGLGSLLTSKILAVEGSVDGTAKVYLVTGEVLVFKKGKLEDIFH
jgi:hypothetical protein